MKGIYKYTNKFTNKVYIGQSIDISSRYEQHYHGKGSFFDKCLTLDGIENYSFEILKIVEREEELSWWEDYYIIKYNSLFPNGYNLKLNTKKDILESIKLQVKIDKEKDSLQSMEIWSIQDITFHFNYYLFEIYLCLFFLSEGITESNQQYVRITSKNSTARAVEKCSYSELSYNACLKYTKMLKEKEILIDEYKNDKPTGFKLLKVIPNIIDYFSYSDYQLAKKDSMILWYINFQIAKQENMNFAAIHFKWFFTVDSTGNYHDGASLVKIRQILLNLHNQGVINIELEKDFNCQRVFKIRRK